MLHVASILAQFGIHDDYVDPPLEDDGLGFVGSFILGTIIIIVLMKMNENGQL